uniref:Uncharacterized protein n=1 Tax=Arundo donax TaxID=35708 RepID=A0A0A9B3D4_ARUDO
MSAIEPPQSCYQLEVFCTSTVHPHQKPDI